MCGHCTVGRQSHRNDTHVPWVQKAVPYSTKNRKYLLRDEGEAPLSTLDSFPSSPTDDQHSTKSATRARFRERKRKRKFRTRTRVPTVWLAVAYHINLVVKNPLTCSLCALPDCISSLPRCATKFFLEETNRVIRSIGLLQRRGLSEADPAQHVAPRQD